uniref:Insulin receptor substrate 2 n=1 Tax=Denticeps clupeoides TaxID=299321 RepID=A0AAY4BMK3_9TELE
MASPPPAAENLLPGSNSKVKKCGYLRKQKHGHRRFFVLKERGEGVPARLEYYETEKKWRNRAAAKRTIALDSCLNVNRRADAKHKHLIALYTKDEYFAVAADSEQEQEAWYQLLAEVLTEGSGSSLPGFDEPYREVWQVTLKSRGLGQSRNLTGVYRLCLSSRTVRFVKLNSEVAAAALPLANIRRCGHSDSLFFVEVGRSAAIGPGELWMQADDSVVAQNIHETVLEAMKAMKELYELRPRSKSQSSGSNPISVPSRRHLTHLPPSQTGLPRRPRTASSPAAKSSSCRIRAASEGDGSMTRPVSVTGSRSHLSRSNTVIHAKSPPSASLSSSSGVPGSPGEADAQRAHAPASIPAYSPPSREGGALHGYMVMGTHQHQHDKDTSSAHRNSITMPHQVSSASLDEYTLMRATHTSHSSNSAYPEDYGDIEIGSLLWSSGVSDDGYMSMNPGVAPSVASRSDEYVRMSPMCVSTPKQILNPRMHQHHHSPQALSISGSSIRTSSPCCSSCSLDDSGYMKMWCGSRLSVESASEYLNMSPVAPSSCSTSLSPSDYFLGELHQQSSLQRLVYSFRSLPRANKPIGKNGDSDQYVLMSPRGSNSCPAPPPLQHPGASSTSASPSAPSPLKQSLVQGRMGQASRLTRLSLDILPTLPSMTEHPLPSKPRSPGEYININVQSPLVSDYMNVNESSHQHRCGGDVLEEDEMCLFVPPTVASCWCKDDYTEMTFGGAPSPPSPGTQTAGSPSSRAQRPSSPERLETFEPPVNPDHAAKVICVKPQGRRRHSSETFSSTTTVPPIVLSFGHGAHRHGSASVESVPVSVRNCDDGLGHQGCSTGSLMCRQTSAGFQNGLNYIALNLMDEKPGGCDSLISFQAASSCKGNVGSIHTNPFTSLYFKETATTVTGESGFFLHLAVNALW